MSATQGPPRPDYFDFDTHFEQCQDCLGWVRWREVVEYKPGKAPEKMRKRFKRCGECASRVWAKRGAP